MLGKTLRRLSGRQFVLSLTVSLFYLAAYSGSALAQTSPQAAGTKPKAEATATPSPTPTAEAEPKATPEAKVQPKKATPAPRAKKKAPAPRRRANSSDFQPDPKAKWSCKETTVTRDPVWRGEQKLTFNFFIVNEGEGDLRIRAKGG